MAGKSLRVFVLVFGVWVVTTQANRGQAQSPTFGKQVFRKQGGLSFISTLSMGPHGGIVVQ